MLINEELFAAFVDCKTKSFLKLTETDADRSEFLEWQRRILDDYKQKCSLRLQERCNASGDCYLGSPSLEDLKGNQYRFVINCVMQVEHLQSSFHALARLDSDPRKLKPYIPIRFVPSEKIAKRDKLLLAFDALVISIASGEMPPFGRIIHGNDQRNVRIGLSELMKSARAIVRDIKDQASTQAPPELMLNRHCGECEFQQHCHAIAVDRDDLSLLSRMTEKGKKAAACQRNSFCNATLLYISPKKKAEAISNTRQ
jgi:predicted RecB family nuclease